MRRPGGRGWIVTAAAGLGLAAAIQGCGVLDSEGACGPDDSGRREVRGSIVDGASVAHAKLRAYFWYGDGVIDERNFILAETLIDDAGGFALELPEPPAGLVDHPEIPAACADSAGITVSDFSVARTNYVEWSVFDSDGAYIDMLYETNRPQAGIALPLSFGYFVYFSGPVHIDGIRTIEAPGYYAPSGEWIDKPVTDRYRYDDVQFTKGWCRYYLQSLSSVETPLRVEREFTVLCATPENIRWHLYDRPDLEP